MNNNLRVAVIGPVGRGKSHVMHTIEKALVEEYGELIQIESEDLAQERHHVGEDINGWQRPNCETITLHEMTEGQLQKQRYKFALVEPEGASRSYRLLIETIEETIVSATVNKHGSEPAVILCLHGDEFKLQEIIHLLCAPKAGFYEPQFVLEDVGLSGTLFATSITGTIKSLELIGQAKVRGTGLEGPTALNLILTY
jgi:energy-coupling factor transporter ATP-binding protein EcfA2